MRIHVAAMLVAGALAMPVVSSAQDDNQNNERFTITPTGYVQFDLRAFPGWDLTPGTGRLNRAEIEVRRLRAGVDGSWRRFTFEFSIDPADEDGVAVKDAYLQVRFSRAFRLRVGQFKVPGTRDYSVSASRLDFLERTPLTSSLAVGRDLGARVDGRRGRLSYDAGLFAGDGVGRDDRAGLTAASRVLWRLGNDLEIAGSASVAQLDAVDSEAANGVTFRAASGYRFADGVYVDGLRVRVGADVEWSPGPWRFIAEGLRLRDDRQEQGLDFEDLPAAIGTGFSASARRRLTNAVEAAVRYDYLGFDDAGDGPVADSVRPRATNIRARASHGVTLGSTWVMRPWLRLLGNVGIERYPEARSAPEAGRPGGYVTLGTRLQLEWP